MARVTAEQVKVILDTDIEDLTPFIDTADLIVSEQLANKGMSEARLDKIELYLAAHYATLRDPQTSSEKIGLSTDIYQGKTGMDLQSSHYGQTAIGLDTSDTLRGGSSASGVVTTKKTSSLRLL